MDDEKHRTPYTDDALRVGHGTTPEHIRDFVLQRATNYHQFGDTIVWNFNNHEPNYEVLNNQVPELMYNRYVIPFQASGVWGYMVQLLPEWLQIVEILAYSQKQGQYIPYPNYLRHSTREEDDEVRNEINERIGQRFDK